MNDFLLLLLLLLLVVVVVVVVMVVAVVDRWIKGAGRGGSVGRGSGEVEAQLLHHRMIGRQFLLFGQVAQRLARAKLVAGRQSVVAGRFRIGIGLGIGLGIGRRGRRRRRRRVGRFHHTSVAAYPKNHQSHYSNNNTIHKLSR